MALALKIDAKGRRSFIKLDRLQSDVETATRNALFNVGRDLVSDLKEAMRKKPKSGRRYRIRVGGRIENHRASAPGEVPARRRGGGALSDSIDYKVRGADQLEFGANTPYARILEVGGRAGRNRSSPIAARNYLKQTIDKNNRNIRSALESNIKIELTKF